MMEEILDSRITDAKNRVFYSEGLGIGRNNPIALKTNANFVYRITGMPQIVDIINCGYIRPKEGKVKGGHKDEVFWSIGGEKTFYYDKRPVLEVSSAAIKDGQVGALPIEALSSIYMFSTEKNCYENKKEIIEQIHELVKGRGIPISLETLNEYLTENNIIASDKIDLEQLEIFLQLKEEENKRLAEIRQQQLNNINLANEQNANKLRG